MSKSEVKEVKKVPYYRKPSNMTTEEWQIALRRQFAEKQNFKVTNLGDHPVFSDFKVFNPESGNEYKVAIRNYAFGDNFCSCPDFKKNGLGTCKHIEYVLSLLKANPENDKYWKAGYKRAYSSLSLKYGEERKVRLRIGTTNSEAVKRLASKYFDDNLFLLPEKYFEIGDFIRKAKDLDKDFTVYNDALDFIIDERDKLIRANLVNSIFDKGINSEYFDGLIKTKLYPYQKEGVIKIIKAGRIIIADDMGLGKTIQAIAATEFLIKELHVSNILIICPTSLKYQWKNEIEKFTGRNVQVVEGTLNKRKQQYLSDKYYKIASYGVGLNDIKYINEAEFDLIILDEAQKIKNWKTKTAKNLKKLGSQYAIVLTGTPLENKLEELHSIVEFIDPYKLGAMFKFLDKHQIVDETGKVIGYKNLNEISKVLSDILIRRQKHEIISQLPGRVDKNYFVDVTDEQMDIHSDYQNIVSRLVNKWRRYGFLSEKDRKRLILSLSSMRMVSDSTYILDQQEKHYDKKIDELKDILQDIFDSGDDKVVIFSQWERMTRLISKELEKMGVDYEYLHGGVPSSKRKKLIDNFREKPEKRIFLSTDAGGVGLNLQSANVIINVDLPWNPAVLEQRIGRVYRLGQQKVVRVINLISRGTIEHRILGVIGFKKSVFEGVLDGGSDQVIMDESKFGKLMKTVEQLNEINEEEIDFAENLEPENKTDVKETIKPVEKDISTDESTKAKEEMEINRLISAGADFLTQLGNTFAKIQTGKIKVSDFIEKNEKTGETSIKIPVQNEETVTKALNTIANLFSAFASSSN